MPQIEDPSSSTYNQTGKTKEQMRKHYLRTLHSVIDQSDIIILVLDARDPEGCRSRLVEEEVRRREMEGKKLVFVLNKIGKTTHHRASRILIVQNRFGTTFECSGMAQASTAFNTHASIPLNIRFAAPAE